MNSGFRSLEAIAREISKPDRALLELVPQAEALRDLFEALTHFHIDHSCNVADGESRLDSGRAVSPTMAALCIREPFRTLAFIRGLAEAIADGLLPERPVRVLYAGCGPYATLALPLMTLFSPKQAVFTLLDVHQVSLDSALALIDKLGLSGHVADAVCTDATRYAIPQDRLPDVIVSETMAVCLHNEPQVTIARHLLSQAPAARLVPQSVSVDAAMLRPGREHALVPADYFGELPEPKRDRVSLGRIFELNATNIMSWAEQRGDRLPAGRITIPPIRDMGYQPFLLTRITVYGRNELKDYDTSLTIPRPLRGRIKLVGGETLQFHYQLGSYPELVYEVMEDDVTPEALPAGCMQTV